MGQFDVDDEYRRGQEQARHRADEANAFYEALKNAGLEGFEKEARRSSSTMNSAPLRGHTRWRIYLPKLRHIELHKADEVDEFLRDLHPAIPWSDVTTSASLVDVCGRPILIFGDQWETDIERALHPEVPFLAGRARERRDAERQLSELVERRRATMNQASSVVYARFHQNSWTDDREWLDWEVFITQDGLFSERRSHPRMREEITADIKAWKYRLE